MSSGKTLRGGMIGAGVWSTNQLNAWARVPQAHIVALCDRDPDRLTRIAAQFNIADTYTTAEAMLARDDLDFVDIATRPGSHAGLIRLVAQRGLPVLCQKPFCTSLREAIEMVELCAQLGVRLMINENFRWQAWYRHAKYLLDQGNLGRPFLMRLSERARWTLPHFNHAQAYFAEMPRLAAYEMGVHYIDTCRFLFGDPQTIYARLHHISPAIVGDDVQVLTLAYPNLTCVVSMSWASRPVLGVDTPADDTPALPPPRFEIDGMRGTLALQANGAMRLERDTDHQDWQFDWDTRPTSRTGPLQHFVECLRSGAEFETSGAYTLTTMALVYGAYLSAQVNRPVTANEMFELTQSDPA